jgi:hypothetical protein
LWAFCTCCWSSSLSIFSWFQQTVLMSWGLLLSFIYSSFLTLLQPSHQHSSECTFIACFDISEPVYQQATCEVMLCESRNCEVMTLAIVAW